MANANGNLWAITCFFNPAGYRRRHRNYLRFRRELSVPLLTVELSYHDRYEIADDEADIVVRLRGRDVLWQKERLLNVALEHLPDACEQVAWLDCDVLLTGGNWASDTASLLERFPVVQLFDQLVHLPREGYVTDVPESAKRTSFGYRWATRTAPDDLFAHADGTVRARCNCGMAWAARRSLLEKHGLYDAMVLGMGDRLFAAAAVGRGADAVRGHGMNARQADHYLVWAESLHNDVAGLLGYRDGTALHLWHGDLTDRRYVERYDDFEAFDFDPRVDLAVDAFGCWRWNTGKPALHRHVEQYFHARHEDGRPTRRAELLAQPERVGEP